MSRTYRRTKKAPTEKIESERAFKVRKGASENVRHTYRSINKRRHNSRNACRRLNRDWE